MRLAINSSQPSQTLSCWGSPVAPSPPHWTILQSWVSAWHFLNHSPTPPFISTDIWRMKLRLVLGDSQQQKARNGAGSQTGWGAFWSSLLETTQWYPTLLTPSCFLEASHSGFLLHYILDFLSISDPFFSFSLRTLGWTVGSFWALLLSSFIVPPWFVSFSQLEVLPMLHYSQACLWALPPFGVPDSFIRTSTCHFHFSVSTYLKLPPFHPTSAFFLTSLYSTSTHPENWALSSNSSFLFSPTFNQSTRVCSQKVSLIHHSSKIKL